MDCSKACVRSWPTCPPHPPQLSSACHGPFAALCPGSPWVHDFSSVPIFSVRGGQRATLRAVKGRRTAGKAWQCPARPHLRGAWALLSLGGESECPSGFRPPQAVFRAQPGGVESLLVFLLPLRNDFLPLTPFLTLKNATHTAERGQPPSRKQPGGAGLTADGGPSSLWLELAGCLAGALRPQQGKPPQPQGIILKKALYFLVRGPRRVMAEKFPTADALKNI